MTLATEQEFTFWVAYGMVLHGCALVMQGQGDRGIAKIRQGLTAFLDTGAELWEAYFLGPLVEADGASGHPEAELSLLAETIAMMDTTEMHLRPKPVFIKLLT